MRPSVVALVLAFAGLAGCGSDAATLSCGVIGATQACLCAGGTSGAQQCTPSGAWSACECGSAGADTVASGDGDVATDVSLDAPGEDAAPDTEVPPTDALGDGSAPVDCVGHAPAHGTIDGGTEPVEVAAGAKATYACEAGYRLVGDAPVCGGSASPGAFDGAEPTCQIEDGEVTVAVTLGASAIGDACFDIEVRDGDGELVWAKGDKSTRSPSVAAAIAEGAACASVYGEPASGDASLVGACHGAAASHTATLWIDNVFATDGTPLTTWVNPCPRGGPGCALPFDCSPLADARVDFAPLLMREARGGFFDLAVTFEGVFCSMRVDTCLTNGDDLEVLFVNGERVKTAVLTFVCLRDGDADLALFADDLVLTCAGHTYVLPPDGDQGPHTPPAGGGVGGWATFWGAETLSSASGDVVKVYWNSALALTPQASGGAGSNCVLTTTLSVADASDPRLALSDTGSGWSTSAGRAHPMFEVEAKLTGAGSWFDHDGNPANGSCQSVGMFDDQPGMRIEPTLTAPPEVHVFCSRSDGTEATRGCP